MEQGGAGAGKTHVSQCSSMCAEWHSRDLLQDFTISTMYAVRRIDGVCRTTECDSNTEYWECMPFDVYGNGHSVHLAPGASVFSAEITELTSWGSNALIVI